MSALDRKMFRDLVHMKGQAIAICLVMACGVATFVMSLVMLRSLEVTLETYYEQYRFADVFAHVKRAPAALRDRIADIPGVARVETRVVEGVTLDMPDLAEPAVGRLISLPDGGTPALCALHLRAGRLPERGREREVVVSEPFAEAHGLHPGDHVVAIIEGRLDELRVVGIALSPEYIYQIKPGDMLPDDRRFGVFWMPETELASAFDMEGAFNDVVIALMPGADEADVIAAVDRLTEPYGSLGAHGREDQTSHEFVSNEIRELRGTAVVAPAIFLAVAGFLLNVVVSRQVSAQREQIAALKALGYGRREIGVHYLKLVGMITIVAVVAGTAVGAWMAAGLTEMYAQFFHFPVLDMAFDVRTPVLALLVSGGAAFAGTMGAVLRAMRLPPAEAMRPAPPPNYRPTILERTGFERFLSPAARMILRNFERRPVKAALSCMGIALGSAVLVLGAFMEDAIEYVIVLQFEVVQRYDLSVAWTDPRTSEATAVIRGLPGVRLVEPYRSVPVRLRAGHRSRRLGIMGLEPEGTLFQMVDVEGERVPIASDGLVLSKKLGELLHVGVGDEVEMEVLEGRKPVVRAPVAALVSGDGGTSAAGRRDGSGPRVPIASLVSDFQGLSAYTSRASLNRLLGEGAITSGAFIAADRRHIDALFRRLKETPLVAAVTLKDAAVESFRDTMAEHLMRMRAFNIGFAVIIAFGVVYNSARISLAERSRELATLRVIGFTRAEISMIQLGELAVLALIGIPAGLVVGYLFAVLTTSVFDTELFRIPLVIERSTYAMAAVVVMIAALASGLAVRRLLDRLDLVAVLKSRE